MPTGLSSGRCFADESTRTHTRTHGRTRAHTHTQLPGQGDKAAADEQLDEASELKPLAKLAKVESEGVLLAKLVGATFATAYLVKYGQVTKHQYEK